MKLIRFGKSGYEKPGILNKNGQIVDLSSAIIDFDEKFFEIGGLERLSTMDLSGFPTVDLASVRLAAAVARPSKIVCIGLNYSDHAKETNSPIPKEPIMFMKASSAWHGPNDDIIIPKNSEKTDWEVELAIVIGKKASYVSESEALNYVAGYATHNDYSERAFQLERGGQWDKGKGCDTFAPFGPYLVTKDEVKDVHNLKLWLKVNGETKQNGTTANLIFNVPFLISYVSQFMTLLPGDVISTGTPAGVGLGFNPPQYLKDGDVVELGIEGLGEQKQKIVSWK